MSLLPQVLTQAGPLPVRFASDGDPVTNGRVYLPPGMKKKSGTFWIENETTKAVNAGDVLRFPDGGPFAGHSGTIIG